MKHLYYEVPQCPNCSGYQTGRYIKRVRFNEGLGEYDALRHNELVEEVEKVPEKNCYCEECGLEWRHHVYGKWISGDEYLRQGRLRHIPERMRDYENRYFINGKPPKRSILSKLLF